MKQRLLTSLMTASLIAGLGTAHAAVMDGFPASGETQVTASNWTLPTYNQWAFRNVGIHPSVMVPRDGETVTIPYNMNETLEQATFAYQGEKVTLLEALAADHTDGYLVIKDGQIVYERYFGEFGPRDHHLWASSTKSLVGMAAGILVEQGQLDTEKKVSAYIPELKNSAFAERTVRDVLNMITALDYSEDYVNMEPGATSTEYFRRLGFIPAYDLMALNPAKDNTPRGIQAFLPSLEQNPELSPRHKFEYHSPNVDVIGWIIERQSGQPLQTYIAENIWGKLGTEHDAFFITDIAYTPVATGGFNTTLRDFARFGLAMANNGQYNGEQLFPEKWVKDTFTLSEEERQHVRKSQYKDTGHVTFDDKLTGYKNFWWIHDEEKGIATARGVFGQTLYVNQDKNVVIATFSSAPSASNAARDSYKLKLDITHQLAEQL